MEHDNLRTALQWALDRREAVVGLRLASALKEFWRIQGHIAEGRRWLDAMLTMSSGLDAVGGHAESVRALRATALQAAGWLASVQGDYDQAVTLLEQSLVLARTVENQPLILAALYALGSTWRRWGDRQGAIPFFEESVVLARALGDRRTLRMAQGNLSVVMRAEGDLERAVALGEELLALQREVSDEDSLGWNFSYLGRMVKDQGNYRRSATLLAEGMQRFQALGYREGIAHTLESYGTLAAAEGHACCKIR